MIRSSFRWKPQVNVKGYFHVSFYNKVTRIEKNYRVHRLVAMAFLSYYSEDLDVDHINGIRGDNRVENLRMVTRSENLRAFRSRPDSATSKYRGVYKPKHRRGWVAQLQVRGFCERLGSFDSEREAAIAWNEAAIKAGRPKECLNEID